MANTPEPAKKRLSKSLEAPRKGRPVRVVGGEPQGESQKAPTAAKIRVIDLTPEDRKEAFAKNLNQLLDVLDLNRKAAAEEIQISYRWVRRVVTSGVSRPDERNKENLDRLVSYFRLPSIEALWTPDLVAALIASELGLRFVEKFGPNISRLVTAQVEHSGHIDKTLVNAWMSTHGEPEQRSAPSYETRLAALVATGRHDSLRQLDALCKRMVEDAYEAEFGEGLEERNGTA